MNALDVGYTLAAAALAPFWARKPRAGWAQRMGKDLGVEPRNEAFKGSRVLLHGVSVGEVNALRGLVELLRARGTEVIVSASTDTGIARAIDLYARGDFPRSVVRYPLDFSWAVKRFLDAVRPDAVGLCELEVWPNFVKACARRNIPVAVVNGRLSERSFKGYRRARWALRGTFARLSAAAVQDDQYAARFVTMGVPLARVSVSGSMKWDSARLDQSPAEADALATAMGIDRTRPLIVAGSTAEGEEAMLHQACPPGVQLLCAPRKPERFEQAAADLPGCIRRSWSKPGGAQPLHVQGLGTTRQRYLLDTIGELRAAYALADVCIVGRSFGKLFGSDPIEPVSLGKATVIGPAFGDFATIVAALKSAGAIEVTAAGDLRRVLRSLLDEPARRTRLAARGRACITEHQGATLRHATLLLTLATHGPVTSQASVTAQDPLATRPPLNNRPPLSTRPPLNNRPPLANGLNNPGPGAGTWPARTPKT